MTDSKHTQPLAAFIVWGWLIAGVSFAWWMQSVAAGIFMLSISGAVGALAIGITEDLTV